MQGNRGGTHAALGEALQQRCVKVQTGCRRRHRTGVAGKHALVALPILGVGRPTDVGRQRHGAMRLKIGQHFLRKLRLPEFPLAAEHAHLAGRALQCSPQADGFAVPDLHQGGSLGERTLQQHLHGAAGGLAQPQTCRDHARIVENQQVTRLQQLRQIGDVQVPVQVATALHDQQAAGAAIGQWALRHQLCGQLKIVMLAHCRGHRFHRTP